MITNCSSLKQFAAHRRIDANGLHPGFNNNFEFKIFEMNNVVLVEENLILSVNAIENNMRRALPHLPLGSPHEQ